MKPYSEDLRERIVKGRENGESVIELSIEMVFSKLKAILRKNAERSFEGLISSTALAIDRFLPSECLNFFRHANYASI